MELSEVADSRHPNLREWSPATFASVTGWATVEQTTNMQIENLTPAMERILKLAEIEAGKDKSYIGTNHVLIGMMLEGGNGSYLMLQGAGFTIEGLRKGESPNR